MTDRGMVFGVFDGLHEGHRHFLSEAVKLCETLVVVVAPPSAVLGLKGKEPKQPLEERMAAIRAWNPTLRVISGDLITGSWDVLRREKPDLVFLGYDQDLLQAELKKEGFNFKVLLAHEPARFKSSLFTE